MNLSENDIASELMRELIQEKRRDRRWKNIRFFLLFVVILGIILMVAFSSQSAGIIGDSKSGYVSFLRLNGTIEAGNSFSSEEVIPLLKDAFADPQAKGVILDIDSGGGSPVQASIIHDAIIELKNKYHKKVIVVGEDLLTSGAYYVAVAADKIYVNPNTIVGSIGVIMKEFGFPELIKKFGIERRVYTSGINKDRLDPFLPQSPEDIAKIKTVIAEVHQNFTNIVIEGRKNKLLGKPEELFNGDFWSGQTAVKLGLADGLGNLFDVLHKEFDVSAYRNYGHPPSLLGTALGQISSSVVLALSERQLKLS